MNKYILLIIGVVLVIGIILAAKLLKPKNIKNPKELELTYKMSAGIPFKRIYEIEDESIVECVKSFISKDENTGGKVGAPVYTTYVFKGLKEGVTTVTFKVVNISDAQDVMSEVKNTIKVDKEGNIFLISEDN